MRSRGTPISQRVRPYVDHPGPDGNKVLVTAITDSAHLDRRWLSGRHLVIGRTWSVAPATDHVLAIRSAERQPESSSALIQSF
jgi:hypothetical protein